MDATNWSLVYFLVGFLWASWIMNRQFFRDLLRECAMPWALVVAGLLSAVFWPIWMVLFVVIKSYAHVRVKKVMRDLAEAARTPEEEEEDSR